MQSAGVKDSATNAEIITDIAIFIVPVLFVVITRLSYGKKKLEYLRAHHNELMEKASKVEQQDIDPQLEYEINEARKLHNKPGEG